MAPNKTIYIADDNLSTWERVEQVAAQTRQSISQIVVRALREHLSHVDAAAEGEITVDMRDDQGRQWAEAFRGRWLIEPHEGNRWGPDAGVCYGIAQTARGKIAVYVRHVNDGWPPALNVYDDLDKAQSDLDLTDEPIAAAAAVMGQRRVIRRDI